MKKLLERNPLGFALMWIGMYVLFFSVADGLSGMLGIEKIVTAPVSVAMTAWLLFWLKGQGKLGYYGIGKGKFSGKAYLYFLPLVLMASTNLWGGVTLRYSVLESGLYVTSMICVGILEEVIFRGLLFRALCEENLKRAVVISSVTFGFGHIVNLLNGAELIPTLLQICYATAAGFLFTVMFLRSGSLIPCIVTHSVINSLSAFSLERSAGMDMLAAVMLTAVSLGYGVWILKQTDTDKKDPSV